jgi:hypothetical protein
MKYFNKDHVLGSDECAIDSYNQQNARLESYMLFNMYRANTLDCGEEVQKLKDFATENHMTFRDGYGTTNACQIDNDSEVRIQPSEHIRGKGKNQMFTRTFQAIPNLGRGEINVENESIIQQGEITFDDFDCQGKALDVFTPMLKCLSDNIQDPNNIVESWTRGGETTRDTLKQKDFLEKNGYQFDGISWNK